MARMARRRVAPGSSATGNGTDRVAPGHPMVRSVGFGCNLWILVGGLVHESHVRNGDMALDRDELAMAVGPASPCHRAARTVPGRASGRAFGSLESERCRCV